MTKPQTPEEKHLKCLRKNWSPNLRQIATTQISSHEIPLESLTFMLEARSALPLLAIMESHNKLETGIFLRCAGFSFKEVDAFHILGNGCVADVTDLRVLLGSGLPRRMFWSINAHLNLQQPVIIEVLNWQSIEPQSEFRVFIMDGKISGISQYHRHFKFPKDDQANDLQSLVDRITEFSNSLLVDLPKFDLAVDVVDTGSTTTLLELNPLTRRTDLGLFNYASLASGRGELRLL